MTTPQEVPTAPLPPEISPAAATPSAVPTRVVVRSVLVAVAAVVLVVLAMLVFEPPGIPDRVETIEPFELIVHNSGRAGHPSLQWFSLRYRGQPVVVHGKAGMYGDRDAEYGTFNSAITFDSPEPLVIVNVGDPINSGFFYLIREKNGQLVTEFLAPSRGTVTAEFLDAPAVRHAERMLTTKRARLGKGQWLLLGDYCVLDAQTLKAYAFSEADAASLDSSVPPLALSPDHHSIVRAGNEQYPGSAPMLIVFDFVGNTSYALPIDRQAMRFVRWDDVDAKWIEHYFAWTTDEGGRQRLVQRSGVVPLPYRGDLKTQANGDREYRLFQVSDAMVTVMTAFLEREFAAARIESGPPDREHVEMRIGDATVHVSRSERDVMVWMNRNAGLTKVIVDIARRFDEELATGRHDALFAAPAPEPPDDSNPGAAPPDTDAPLPR